MKKLLFLFAFIISASNLSAATTYKIVKVDLKTDSLLGTFISNGRTFGAIVGAAYVLEATSDSGEKTRFTSDFWLATPRLSLPSLANIKAAVRDDAISKKAKDQMDSALIRTSIDIQPFIPVLGEDAGL